MRYRAPLETDKGWVYDPRNGQMYPPMPRIFGTCTRCGLYGPRAETAARVLDVCDNCVTYEDER